MIDYFAATGASNSGLGTLNPEQGGYPEKYLSFLTGDVERKTSLSLERGTLLHNWIENPDAFIIEETNKPSPQITVFTEELYKAELEIREQSESMFLTEEEIFGAAVSVAYLNTGTKLSKEVILERFDKEGKDYYRFLHEKSGKIMMTKATKDIVTGCYQGLHKNPKSFQHLILRTESNLYLVEEPMFWQEEIDGQVLEFKAKPDQVEIDFGLRIVRLKDLKTTSSPIYLFKDKFEFWRYYRQLAFYKRAIAEYCKQNNINIKGFKFEAIIVAVETNPPFKSVVFNISADYILKGKLEAESLMSRLSWHTKNKIWDMSMEEYNNNGVILL